MASALALLAELAACKALQEAKTFTCKLSSRYKSICEHSDITHSHAQQRRQAEAAAPVAAHRPAAEPWCIHERRGRGAASNLVEARAEHLTHAVWSAILRSNHGGLRIAAGDDGLRVARLLWGVRAHLSEPVSHDPTIDGFFALATNCAAAPYAAQSYWADGLFRRETWRMYSTKQTGGAPVLAVAAFLAIGDLNEEPLSVRSFLLDLTETNANGSGRLDMQRHSTTSASLAAVFLEIWGSMGEDEAEGYHDNEETRMILERCCNPSAARPPEWTRSSGAGSMRRSSKIAATASRPTRALKELLVISRHQRRWR